MVLRDASASKNPERKCDTWPGPEQPPVANLVGAKCICDGGNPKSPFHFFVNSRNFPDVNYFAVELSQYIQRMVVLTNLKDVRVCINEEGAVNHPCRW